MIAAIRRLIAVHVIEARRAGWCVRLDWPDGSHDLTAYRAGAAPAGRAAAAAAAFWSHGPVRPLSCTVVPVSRHDWRLHRIREGCRAPDCPKTSGTGGRRREGQR